MRTALVAVSLACLAAATPSHAVPVIDGTRDAEYGAAKALRRRRTHGH